MPLLVAEWRDGGHPPQLELALKRGALCVGITNTVGSAIARRTHCGVHINAGAEIGVASTKAYTSQIVVLLLLALALSGDSISSQDDRRAIIEGLGALSPAVKRTLGLDASIAKLAEKLKDEHSLLIFGRGSNYATAIEGALKVKEVSLMHSEGILAGEMKHGPLALVDEHMPIVVIATPDSVYGKMMSVIEQLRARGANLIVICSEDDTEIARVSGLRPSCYRSMRRRVCSAHRQHRPAPASQLPPGHQEAAQGRRR